MPASGRPPAISPAEGYNRHMPALRFETPEALLLLPLVAAALLAWARLRLRPAVRIGSASLAAGLPVTWRQRARYAPALLRALAVASLVVALARPQSGTAATRSSQQGIDIVLAFDVSSSMSQPFARDRSRLDVAEDVLSQFVRSRQRDRVGLVAFQGSSLTMSPLTTDYAAVAEAVRNSGQLRLKDGTAIGVAIGQSVNLLRDSDAASRAVVLLTDGENNVRTIDPLAAARLAESLGVRVYTVGVVSLPPESAVERSRVGVDEQALKQIAEVTGGTYSRAEDPQGLRATYDRIDALERSRLPAGAGRTWREIAPYALAAALAALLLEAGLRASVLRGLP